MKRLLDTNIVLYHLAGRLADPLPPDNYAVSVITEMELFTFASRDCAAEAQIWKFLGQLTIVPLTDEIQTMSVQLRTTYDLKLPDAVIAATAICTHAELLTNDPTLRDVPGLRLKSLK